MDSAARLALPVTSEAHEASTGLLVHVIDPKCFVRHKQDLRVALGARAVFHHFPTDSFVESFFPGHALGVDGDGIGRRPGGPVLTTAYRQARFELCRGLA